MTQEEKAKAYDEALKIARCWLNSSQTIQDCNYTIKDAIQNIFPQLRESEDERTRKYLIDFVGLSDNPRKGEMIAYLEKQKENPKSAISIPADCASNARCPYKIYGDEDFIGDIKDTPAYHFGFDEGVRSERGKQKDQKPAWSEEDKNAITTAIRACRYMTENFENSTEQYEDAIERLKSLRPQPKQEPKPVEKQDYSGLNDLERAIHRGFLCAGVENVPVGIIKETAQDCLAHLSVEWSEEDKKMLDSILAELANHICYNKPLDGMPSGTGWTSYKYQQEMDWLTNRLKSLRPGWKPTEEQMEALMLAIEGKCPPTSYMSRRLEDLYDGLANTYKIEAKLD